MRVRHAPTEAGPELLRTMKQPRPFGELAVK